MATGWDNTNSSRGSVMGALAGAITHRSGEELAGGMQPDSQHCNDIVEVDCAPSRNRVGRVWSAYLEKPPDNFASDDPLQDEDSESPASSEDEEEVQIQNHDVWVRNEHQYTVRVSTMESKELIHYIEPLLRYTLPQCWRDPLKAILRSASSENVFLEYISFMRDVIKKILQLKSSLLHVEHVLQLDLSCKPQFFAFDKWYNMMAGLTLGFEDITSIKNIHYSRCAVIVPILLHPATLRGFLVVLQVLEELSKQIKLHHITTLLYLKQDEAKQVLSLLNSHNGSLEDKKYHKQSPLCQTIGNLLTKLGLRNEDTPGQTDNKIKAIPVPRNLHLINAVVYAFYGNSTALVMESTL